MLLFYKNEPVYVKLKNKKLLEEKKHTTNYVSRIWEDANNRIQYKTLPVYTSINGLTPLKNGYAIPLLFLPVEFMEIENKYILNRQNSFTIKALNDVELYAVSEKAVINTPIVIELLFIKNFKTKGLLTKYDEYVKRAINLFYNHYNFRVITKILEDNWYNNETPGGYFYIEIQGLPVPMFISNTYKHLPTVFNINIQDYNQVLEFVKHTSLRKKLYGITEPKSKYWYNNNRLFFIGDKEKVHTYIYSKHSKESIIISPEKINDEELTDIIHKMKNTKLENKVNDIEKLLQASEKITLLQSQTQQ